MTIGRAILLGTALAGFAAAATAAVPGPAAVPAAAPGSTALAALLGEARGWLLAGEAPPADLRLRLQGLEPGDRLLAIVWLRRAGLVDGPAFAPDFILAPVEAAAE